VIGTEDLFVVDTSIMPSTVQGCINSATVTVAERAVDLLAA